MHYGIITYGSRGDVQPYIALSLGLMERGYEVTLFANENFAGFVEGYGINFYPLYGNIEAMVHSPEVLRILESGNMVSFLRELQRMSRSIQPRINAEMFGGCEKPDFLIASPLAMIWVYSIAEKLNKKWAIVQLSVPAVPTKEFPFAGFGFFNAPWYNPFTHRLFRYIYWRLNKKDINNHRISLGLTPLRESLLKKTTGQKILNLYAFSPSLIARPKDWRSEVDITGFLTISPSKRKLVASEQPEKNLIQWLEAGERPVYIGFGSIPIPNTTKFAAILQEMIEKTSHRFIFCEGWSALSGLPQHSRLFVLKSVNHQWLLPQCKTAVIHGGIGTIAAVLSASTPAIIVSIFGDQPLWGKIIAGKKLGIHIPFKILTTQKLLNAIEETQAFKITRSVHLISERMSREDGVRLAIQHLEKYFYNAPV
jgi:sterol 3beta-glucosyltransferase